MKLQKKQKSYYIGLITGAIILLLTIFIFVGNTNSLEFSISNGEKIHVEYGEYQELPEVTALYKGSLINRKGISVPIVREGEVDLNQIGEYEVSYKARYRGVAKEIIVTVVVEDTMPPIIALVKNTNYLTKPNKKYIEEGFSAYDNYDGDVSNQVVRLETNGSVKYIVSDSSGNQTEVERKIIYGESQEIVAAQENQETDLEENTENIDTQQPEQEVVIPTDKVIYLTFDDGPGPYTQKLLGILKEHDVSATFFVTNQEPEYAFLIGEAYRQGHSVGLHTYSHNYSIYSSEESYYNDLNQMKEICVAQTGQEPVLVRFPGGTSNTISQNYCKGIMTTLSQTLPEKGYLYCDWNVASGDAEGATTADEVAAKVIQGISGNQISIVLQHDLKEFSVDAVDKIVTWGLEHGYTFLPLSENSHFVQHEPLN